MAKPNRKCLCCGAEYYFCPTCGPRIQQLWKNNYDNENCREVFLVATDYLAGVLSAEQAKARLSKCDLNQKDSFVDTIKDVIKSLYSADVEGNTVAEHADVKDKPSGESKRDEYQSKNQYKYNKYDKRH